MSQPLSPPPVPQSNYGQAPYAVGAYPQPGYGQPAYGQAVYGHAPYVQAYPSSYSPRPKRPALTARAKRGSMIAGAVSFLGLTIGWLAISTTLIAAVLVGVLGALSAQYESSYGSGTDDTLEWISRVWEVGIGWFVGLLVVGLVIMAVSFLIGRRILGVHGVNRPTAVLWSSFGVAVGAYVVIWIFLNTFGGLLGPLFAIAFAGGADEGKYETAVVVFVVTGLLWLGGTIAIGLFSCWWMAHTYRPQVPVVDPAPLPFGITQPDVGVHGVMLPLPTSYRP